MESLQTAESTLRDQNIWAWNFPKLAFENDALLYSMLAISALHIAKTEPENLEAIDQHRSYLDLGIRRHSEDICNIDKFNANAISLTSSFLRIASFAVLQERTLTPYVPPSEWLHMTRSAGRLLRLTLAHNDDENSIMMRMTRRVPFDVFKEDPFENTNNPELLRLLANDHLDNPVEMIDEESQHAYRSTINQLGAVIDAIKAEEAAPSVGRRMILFAIWIRPRFIDLVDERQPRALVILAHYFALLARFRRLWWIGDTGVRETRAIEKILPMEWQSLMALPQKFLQEDLEM